VRLNSGTKPETLMYKTYEPTPEEIAILCLEIQASWSELDIRKRMGLSPTKQPWQPPSCHLDSEITAETEYRRPADSSSIARDS